MARVVIVSNRVPAPRERGLQAGGLTVALRDSLALRDGLWFGWSGDVTKSGIGAPRLAGGGFTTAVVDLSPEDHDGYYVGYANGTLWPLLHYRLGLLDYRRPHFDAYMRVNAAFAAALLPLLRPDDIVWVHDYHLIPFAAALRARGADHRIGLFLHVPFPPPAVMEALPDHDVLGRMLAACDVVGVQTAMDLGHLRDYLVRVLGAVPEGADVVRLEGRRVHLGAFDVGIDTDGFLRLARDALTSSEATRLRDSLQGRRLIIGVDRLDYSKGLPQRFAAYDAFLTARAQHRRRVTYLQVAPPSRGEVRQYRALRRELEQLAGRVNGRFAEFDWMPLRYVNKAIARRTLAGFYRMSQVGLVTPLRDGMNLVAKEYVAAQPPDDPGVLVLSRFAGAAERLDGALLVNPLDVDGVAAAIDAALGMPAEERIARWRRMDEVVRTRTARRWAEDFLDTLAASRAA